MMKIINQNNSIECNAPKFWGIVNITPDSFSDGGLFLDSHKALEQAKSLLYNNGAHFIDIGAASSRPSAGFISEEEEWARLEPFLNLAESNNKEIFPQLSLDTWRASIAEKAMKKGINIINDISAFNWDNRLLDVLLEHQPYYVLMHCKGKPDTMQDEPKYACVVDEVYAFFEEKLNVLIKKGFPREKIILDQGIGFGKTQEHNKALLEASEKFLEFDLPLMAAISRKSLIRHLYSINANDINALDEATAQYTHALIQKGYTHHRVHNVQKCVKYLEENNCV